MAHGGLIGRPPHRYVLTHVTPSPNTNLEARRAHGGLIGRPPHRYGLRHLAPSPGTNLDFDVFCRITKSRGSHCEAPLVGG